MTKYGLMFVVAVISLASRALADVASVTNVEDAINNLTSQATTGLGFIAGACLVLCGLGLVIYYIFFAARKAKSAGGR